MRTKTPYQLRQQMTRILDNYVEYINPSKPIDPRIVAVYHNVFLRYIDNMRRYIDGKSPVKTWGDIGQFTPVPASVYAKQV